NRALFGGATAGVVERNTGGLGDGSGHLEPSARGIPVGPKGLRPKRTVAKATLVDKKLEPCESFSAWARQLGSPGATRPLTAASAAFGSRQRAITAMRLPSVGALAAAITAGSTSGTRTRNGFARRGAIGGHPFAGIGTPKPRAGGTECSAPQWR